MMTNENRIEKLKTIGYPAILREKDWVYLDEYGFTSDDIPALIELLEEPSPVDEWGTVEDEMPLWAQVHGWRLAAQLRAVEAIPALIKLSIKDQWEEFLWEEMPGVFGKIGPDAIDPIHETVKQVAADEELSMVFISALGKIIEFHPETRHEIVAVATELLQNAEHNSSITNANLITLLAENEATDALPVIEAAYERDQVDLSVLGLYDNVLVAMGLQDEDTIPPRNYTHLENERRERLGLKLLPDLSAESRRILDEMFRENSSESVFGKKTTAKKTDAKKKKAKRKEAKKSRKRNRKK